MASRDGVTRANEATARWRQGVRLDNGMWCGGQGMVARTLGRKGVTGVGKHRCRRSARHPQLSRIASDLSICTMKALKLSSWWRLCVPFAL